MKDYGIITNIQKYTIHDGPGIRTEIFFKGCPLHCLWCSNPEDMESRSQLGFYPTKCIGTEHCGWCRKACPAPPENRHVSVLFPSQQCSSCLRCAEVCPSGAIKLWGKRYTVQQLMDEILKDMAFYERSGGGVTLNGGEVLLQWEFAAELLKACREQHIHTCVESALHVPTEHMEQVLAYTDLVIADIKHMDTEAHRRITGAGNEQILNNLKRIAALDIPLVIRTPVCIGYNGEEANIRAIGAFLRDELQGKILQYQLLPYRRMGTEKYACLQKAYPMENYAAPEREKWEANLRALAELLRTEYSLPAVEGSGHRLPLRQAD